MAAPPDRRLLIIDDDTGLLEIFRLFMEKQGFSVASAEDGLLGLEKAKVFKPHLIVLDLMMPKLNGFEVIHRLQAEGLGAIPVIIITGFSNPANEQILRQEPNVVDFLSKPVDHAALVKRIRSLLS
jgi:adenylate cyclase